MTFFALGLLLLAAAIITFAWDRRAWRTGILTCLGVVWVASAGLGALLQTVEWAAGSQMAAAFVFLGLLGLGLLAVLILTGYLIANGITVVRREGRSLANGLSLLVGLAMGAAVALVLFTVVTNEGAVVRWIILGMPPLSLIAFLFVAFLLQTLLYRRSVLRRPGDPAAVVALGSWVNGTTLTPLLAARVDMALAVWRRQSEAGSCRLVLSGGQGPDEPMAEAEVMARHAEEEGVPASEILVESRSRTTEQNLRYSVEMLTLAGVDGPILVATSDYHALRAGMLMRREGIAGDALGARTASYFRPSATLREFVAVLRDHRVPVGVCLGLSVLPLLAAGVFMGLRLLGG